MRFATSSTVENGESSRQSPKKENIFKPALKKRKIESSKNRINKYQGSTYKMPSYVYVDDGVRGYYVDDNEDWSHICKSCNDFFETTRPLPSEEARFCADCYFDAINVIQLWWRNRSHNKKNVSLPRVS